ncbi:MAG: outer membrane beta-barrel protein, partial [Dysgonamonadaceae bacterium]|nr:outer membrane beta-barrel protein [Dysgonamonadaceae bacterium]
GYSPSGSEYGEGGYGRGSHWEVSHEGWNMVVSPGYHVTDRLFAGVGVGLYNYSASITSEVMDLESSFLSVPIYAHGMWKFSGSQKPSLFVSLKAGYGIISKSMYPVKGIAELEKIESHFSGGLYVSPSLGYMYPINNKNSLSLSVSYDVQQYKEEREDKATSVMMGEKDKTNSTIAVKVGWAF